MTRRGRQALADPVATPATAAQCISLTNKAGDQVAELSGVFKAYLALERFVSPEYADDEQASVPACRSELGALLHTLNAEMLRQIGALADTLTVLQAQMANSPKTTPTR